MKSLKVIRVSSDVIEFENNVKLYSNHDTSCCESHDLSMSDLTLSDFEGLEFDLSNENFFKRINGYGIELIPIKGHSIRIPGYGFNNGYYSDKLDLIIEKDNKVMKIYDISECQDVNG